MTSDETHTPYDAELPILAELEDVWRAAALRAIEVSAKPAHVTAPSTRHAVATPPLTTSRPGSFLPDLPAAPPAPDERHAIRRRATQRRADAGRIARRVGVLTGLTCLVAASAVAMRSLVSNGAGDPTLRTSATVRLAGGTIDGSKWFLDAYRRGAETCYDLIATGRLATACADAPGPRDVHVDGTLGPMTRVVIGLAGARVATVRVSEGSRQRLVQTQAVPAHGKARAARLPHGLRFFVATLPRTDAPVSRGSAQVVRYDAGGRRLGTAVVKP